MAETMIAYATQIKDVKRQAVVKLFGETSPVLQRLNFIDIGDSMGYEYDKETKLPGVGTRGINGTYGAQTEGVTVPVREGTAILGGPVRTDVQLLARKPGRMARKAVAAGLLFTRLFFDGSQLSRPTEFDGLNARLGTGPQAFATGDNGDDLDLDAFAYLCDLVIGSDDQKVAHMGKAMRRCLGAAIRAAGSTYIQMADWAGPLNPTKFNNVTIEVVENDETDTPILAFDETCGTSDETGSIYVINYGRQMDEDRLQGIAKMAAQGLFEVREEGVRDSMDQAMVEGRAGLATFHGRSIARYHGITNGLGEFNS